MRPNALSRLTSWIRNRFSSPELVPLKPAVQFPFETRPSKKSLRQPHPRTGSLAHAGYCMMVDVLKTYLRENLHDPVLVHVDHAAEQILLQYATEKGLLKSGSLREQVTTLFGFPIVWDAPHFHFLSEEEVQMLVKSLPQIQFQTVIGGKSYSPQEVAENPDLLRCTKPVPYKVQIPKLRVVDENDQEVPSGTLPTPAES